MTMLAPWIVGSVDTGVSSPAAPRTSNRAPTPNMSSTIEPSASKITGDQPSPSTRQKCFQ